MPEPIKVYYFGYREGAGHFLWDEAGSYFTHHKPSQLPWSYSELDSELCPQGPQVQGLALLHHRGEWSGIAFWDRSGDTRPGSNTGFYINRPNASFEEVVVAAAKRVFPDVWQRFHFEVGLYVPHEVGT